MILDNLLVKIVLHDSFYSKKVLIKLIYHIMLWLNTFPTKAGVSAMLLPCKIVYRHKLDFAKHCKA